MTQDNRWSTVLALPRMDRIVFLYKEVYWHLDTQTHLLDTLESRLRMPPRQRPSSMLITAESGMGKSATMLEFIRRHPAARHPGSGALIQSVVSVEIPPIPTPETLLKEVLSEMGFRVRERTYNDLCQFFVYQARELVIQLICVDETQRIAYRPNREAANLLELLKWMASVVRHPIVAVGTPEIAPLFKRDSQLKRRFEHYQLEPWKLDDHFACFVQAVLNNMPLREGYDPAIHTDRAILSRILETSDNVTGLVIAYIQRASEKVLLGGRERLTTDDLL